MNCTTCHDSGLVASFGMGEDGLSAYQVPCPRCAVALMPGEPALTSAGGDGTHFSCDVLPSLHAIQTPNTF